MEVIGMAEQWLKCISCYGESFKKYSETSDLQLPLFQCQNCQLIVAGSSLNETKKVMHISTKKFWDFEWDNCETYFSDKSGFSDVISEGKERSFISQYKYVKKFLKNKKVLEIGSGVGQTIYWLDQLGFEVLGIEPDPRNVSAINEKLNNSKVIQSNAEDFQNNDKYGLIWVSHVLEHLVFPVEFLQQMKENLDDDGILFIEVPNCEYPPELKLSIMNPHVWHFRKNSLLNVCENAGFEIVACNIFRPAKKIEGFMNKISKNLHPYYPRIIADEKSGTDLRVILKNKKKKYSDVT